MNHVYRLVWNQAAQRPIPAPESAKGRGKSGRRGATTLLAAGIIGSVATAAVSAPTGGSVVAGSGSITQAGNTTTIQQNSFNLTIDWTTFGSTSSERIVFNQPSTSSIALNRVTGREVSVLDGSLTANGQVWILNPNGILFGKTASVDVGGLVASTLALDSADLLAGKKQFSGASGSVINRGSIRGGYVALLGSEVRNEGQIEAAAGGSVLLGAGRKITLDFDGDRLLNLQVDEGALGALIDNQGVIRADAGTVILSAAAKDALLGTLVNNDGIIEAHRLDQQGGVIKLLGDTVKVAGTLDASAPVRGDGGFIETSGSRVRIADTAKIRFGAAAGRGGSWLIDPVDFTIGSGGDMSAATLESALAGGGTVTIQSSDGSSGSHGDINVNNAVSWSSDATLKLQAAGDINLNADISATGSNAGLVLGHGSGGDYHVASGHKITLSGSNASLAVGTAGSEQSYTLIHDVGQLQAMAGSGYFALGNDIDASATATWNSGAGFVPIASVDNFTLTGLGHNIAGLTINRSANNQALLGTAANTTLRDLGLSSVSIQGGQGTGTLVGLAWGAVTLSHIDIAGSIRGTTYTGGAIGQTTNYYQTLDHISINADVTGAGSTGGLVGAFRPGGYFQVSNSSFTGQVSGGSDVGGLVGSSAAINSTYALFANNQVSAQVTGTNYVGGLIGRVAGDTVVAGNSTAGNVSGASYVGGAVGGTASTVVPLYIVDSTSQANVTATGSYVGGLIGYSSARIANSSASGSVTVNASNNVDSIGGLVGYQAANAHADFSNSALWPTGYDPSPGATAQLSNVSASGNVTVTTTNQYDGIGVGGLVGQLAGGGGTAVLSNAGASGTVQVEVANGVAPFVGGLVGYNDGWSIQRGQASGDVSARITTGMVAAGMPVTSLAYLDATGSDIVGGLVGYNAAGTISDSHATGAVSSPNTAGGLVGLNSGIITRSYATGNVGETNDFGTANGVLTNKLGFAGGLVGINAETTWSGSLTSQLGQISDSFATGDVSAVKFAGGLVGVNGVNFASGTANTIADSYASGAVTSPYYAGGLVGVIYSGANTVQRSLALGLVTGNGGSAHAGGFAAGSQSGDACQACYWSLTGTGQGTSADTATGLTDAQLKSASSYAGWDISGVGGSTSIWRIYEGYTAPLLRTFLTPLTVDANSVTKQYDGLAYTGPISYTLAVGTSAWRSSGVLDASQLLGSIAVGSHTHAGSYVLGDGLYSTQFGYDISATGQLVITPAPLTITAGSVTKTYDATAFSGGSAGYAGFAAGENASVLTGALTFGGTSQGARNAGSYTIVPGGLASSDYAITYVNGTLTINPASITISTTPVTKTYDGTTSAAGSATVVSGTLFGTDSLSGGSFAFTDKNASPIVGSKTVTVGGVTVNDGNGGGNYVVTYAPNTVSTIYQQNVHLADVIVDNKTYDGTAGANVSAYTSSGLIGGDDVRLSGSAAFADKNAGVGKVANVTGIHLTGSDAGNYLLDTDMYSTSADIMPASITVGAAPVSKVYNGTTAAAGTAVVVGGTLFGTDTLSGGSFAFADKNAGQNKVVSTTGVTVNDGFGGGNYYVSYADTANGTINPAAITISTTPVTKTYDGTTSAAGSATVVAGTLFGTDTLSGGSFAFADKNAGQNKVVSTTGVTVNDGFSGGNYSVSYADAANGTINPAAITISTTPVTKTYDGTTSAAGSATVVAGTLFGTDTLSGGSFAFADKNAGQNKLVSTANVTVNDGFSGGNYSVSYADAANGTITKAGLTVSGASAQDKGYDGSTAATIVGATPGALFGSDQVTIGGGGTFADRHAGTGRAVTAALTLSGPDAGNYQLIQPTGLIADITPAPISITSTDVVKTYDGTTAATGTVRLSSGTLYGTDSLAGGQFAFTDRNAGAGNKTVTVGNVVVQDGNGGQDYTVTYVANQTSTINPATLTIRAGDLQVATGQALPPFTASIDGFQAGDSASTTLAGTPSFTTPATNGSAPGRYAITPSGYILLNGNYVPVYVDGTLTITGSPSVPGAPADGYSASVTSAQQPAPFPGVPDFRSGQGSAVSGLHAYTDTPSDRISSELALHVERCGMRLPPGIAAECL